VLLTDATLTKAQAQKVAAVSHDGMARAIAPLHSMTDGDTVFCLASGRRSAVTDPVTAVSQFNALLAAAADVFTEACLSAMVTAETGDGCPSYAALAPSTVSGTSWARQPA
jgi:L-aminopeptidase/D-esterase-like protein